VEKALRATGANRFSSGSLFMRKQRNPGGDRPSGTSNICFVMVDYESTSTWEEAGKNPGRIYDDGSNAARVPHSCSCQSLYRQAGVRVACAGKQQACQKHRRRRSRRGDRWVGWGLFPCEPLAQMLPSENCAKIEICANKAQLCSARRARLGILESLECGDESARAGIQARPHMSIKTMLSERGVLQSMLSHSHIYDACRRGATPDAYPSFTNANTWYGS
jgi:hypothetical protein